MFLKLVLLAAVVGIAMSQGNNNNNNNNNNGDSGSDYGHHGWHGYHFGYDFHAEGKGHKGHYGGQGKVQLHQTEHNYDYHLQEHGPHHQKHVEQSASFYHH